MIQVNNYRLINQQCISVQACRLAGLIYLPLFLQRADSSDRPLIYSLGWEGQDSQAAALHQSWIQLLRLSAFQRGMAQCVAGVKQGDEMGSEVQILQLSLW